MRLVAGLGFTTLVALLSGCPGRPATDAKEAQQPIPVKTLTVAPASAAQTLEAVGQAEGQREVEVRARVGGILLQRAYNEGDPVR
ncbi:MAG: efflux transporter periplasmic adaptor subunit, partial [Betaproteobacteria bacterium]|nr:efflux transporter periplasmic adaptor subunit [Betaproteobacteria bacterium]